MEITDLAWAIFIMLIFLLVLNLAGLWLFRFIFSPFEQPPLFVRRPTYRIDFFRNSFLLMWTYFAITVMYSFAGGSLATFVSFETQVRSGTTVEIPVSYVLIPALLGTLYAAAARALATVARFSRILNSLYYQMIVLSGAVIILINPWGPIDTSIAKNIFMRVFDTVSKNAEEGFILGIVMLQIFTVVANEIFKSVFPLEEVDVAVAKLP